MLTAKEFGNFVSLKRHEKGLTQKELAEKLYVTDKAVSRWERGLGFPDVLAIQPLAEALGVSVNDLLEGKDSSTETNHSQDFPQNSIQDIIDAFAQERSAFQKKYKRKKRIVIAVGICLFIAIVCSFFPFPSRVNQTLYGYKTIEGNNQERVVVVIDGWLLRYLFKGTFLLANIQCFRGDENELLFERWLSGHEVPGTNRFAGMTGKLTSTEEGYYYSGATTFLTDTEEKIFFQWENFRAPLMTFVTNKDFSKLLLEHELFPGMIVVSSDPDVDLERMKERLVKSFNQKGGSE